MLLSVNQYLNFENYLRFYLDGNVWLLSVSDTFSLSDYKHCKCHPQDKKGLDEIIEKKDDAL
mgnify:CR=1 FL=1